MTKTILIDAAHREETRVAVLQDGILQDFDREAISIKQIKGNIYLAKVTRVEPSLQAAFVDYGSDRHGFLPFADIHPDYYQISDADRQKLREMNNEQQTQRHDDEDGNSEGSQQRQANSHGASDERNRNRDREEDAEESIVTGAYSVEDETENYQGNIHSIYKRYSIQDVIKPGQLMLVQASKEERGNKGASMTTYISLAGKYCVLMSNTPNKGGVSKKVDNFRDRKILKTILNELNIAADRSVIIRTAGVGKRPEEIKRDCDYLSRLWDSIKESSNSSKAPAFIHAEDDVIKRCIRDVYNEQVNEVVVEGAEAFETVMNFVKLTMPHSAHNIKLHDDRVPVFNKYRVEQQISSLYEKQISLPSGGSIVIDHTEALVAIDVNSGRSTKENRIEETAFSTNFEAVKEIARQLRLRDLAGLVVIDFIDMYDQKHRRNVERALRDELQNDRARIQLGRISVFGLLEMSRQRLGASFFETITEPCKHCNGTGYVRSVEILAVSILRAIRHACADKQAGVIYIYASPETIAYIMNFKKAEILATEKNYDIHIFMHPESDVGPHGFNIKKRKGLLDEEKRDMEMKIVTGKVNQLGLEKSYFEENYSNQDAPAEENSDRRPHHQNRKSNKDNKFRNNRRDNNNNRRKFDDRSSNKKSFLGSIFSAFSR
jgi:ribonuclease E